MVASRALLGDAGGDLALAEGEETGNGDFPDCGAPFPVSVEPIVGVLEVGAAGRGDAQTPIDRLRHRDPRFQMAHLAPEPVADRVRHQAAVFRDSHPVVGELERLPMLVALGATGAGRRRPGQNGKRQKQDRGAGAHGATMAVDHPRGNRQGLSRPAGFGDRPVTLPRLCLVSLLLLLAGCQAMAERQVAYLIKPDAAPLTGFDVCHGSRCKVRTRVILADEQWAEVRGEFAGVTDALAERKAIRGAIGLMERLVAEPTGTGSDVGDNIFARDQSTQLDCIDETVNATTYLRMMAADGLLRFHSVELPAHRGGMVSAHNTAVILDRASGKRYAVDPSFFDNGNPAVVLTLDTWLTGWRPGDSPPDIGEVSASALPVVATCRCSDGVEAEVLTIEP